MTKIKRALLSVSDKEGIVPLAKFLTENGVEIISSGGTRKSLEEKGIAVTPIESVTGNPEAFGGRMKTLSFQVSSALLFRRNHGEDIDTAKKLGIEAIDLVVCNLYPFAEVAKKQGDFDELIENIDIGGPTMVRAAAKNHQAVTVLTNPSQYNLFVELFNVGAGAIDDVAKSHFALEAFRHTAEYDSLITETLQQRLLGSRSSFHGHATGPYANEVRYGENPHQKGFVIKGLNTKERTRLAEAPAIQGKALSYNNYLDADASWRCNSDLHMQSPDKHCVTVVKHSNPCGASVATSSSEALRLAWQGDPISAFGSIITFNKKLDLECAQFLSERFVEVIIAPEFDDNALEILSKKKNLRLLKLSPETESFDDLMIRTIDGGFLAQQEDNGQELEIKQVVGQHDSLNNDGLIAFGLKVTKHLKSNAIGLVAAIDGQMTLLGAGMGNPNRLISLQQAVEKAKENGHDDLGDALLVSDAFFPFRDNIDEACKFGIRAILQPGGSIKDKEVINACEELGIAMAFTGMRHFRH